MKMSQVKNVNTTDIADAIRLGCRTMQNIFNADDNNIPFFGSCVWPTPQLTFSGYHSEAHVPGRHLNALLNAEDAIGIKLDESAIENHRRAALFSYSGPLPLPLNRTAIGGELVNFCPHNLREGLHALYALTRYRNDQQARELAENSITAILKLWNPETGWDLKHIRELGIVYQDCESFVSGEARMLGPLVKFYRATNYAPALELALLFKDKLINEFYLADGSYDPARFITSHGHSITCVMSSLAQFAELTNDAALMMRVKAFFDNGLWQMRDAIGWTPESAIPPGNQQRGESNNTGDVLETALILGKWGFTEYYHDAERILRCHLLPSQLRDISFIQDPPNPDNIDGFRDIANRHLGAWGLPVPYGHKYPGMDYLCFNMDIVGGAVGSLCEAYRHIVRKEATGLWVNLLFDYEDADIRVESNYTHDSLRITPMSSNSLWVRIPSWVNRDKMSVQSNNCTYLNTGGYLFFADPTVAQPIEIKYDKPVQELILRHSNQDIRARLRGDSMESMDNLGMDLTFFGNYE